MKGEDLIEEYTFRNDGTEEILLSDISGENERAVPNRLHLAELDWQRP